MLLARVIRCLYRPFGTNSSSSSLELEASLWMAAAASLLVEDILGSKPSL